jgi:hypothetical protein
VIDEPVVRLNVTIPAGEADHSISLSVAVDGSTVALMVKKTPGENGEGTERGFMVIDSTGVLP